MADNKQTIPVQNDDDLNVRGGGGGGVYVNTEDGTYQAVIVDIINLGLVKSNNTKFKDSEKLRLVYQLDAEITEDLVRAAYEAEGKTPTEDQLKAVGRRFTLREDFNKTLGSADKKSNYTKRIESIIKRNLTPEEYDKGFPSLTLLGKNVQVTVTNTPLKSDPKRSFPKVTSVIAWPTKYGAPIEGKDYIRLKDRKDDAKSEDVPWKE